MLPCHAIGTTVFAPPRSTKEFLPSWHDAVVSRLLTQNIPRTDGRRGGGKLFPAALGSWDGDFFLTLSNTPTNVEVGKFFFDSVLDRVLTNYRAINDV